jgi:hypothetical protein
LFQEGLLLGDISIQFRGDQFQQRLVFLHLVAVIDEHLPDIGGQLGVDRRLFQRLDPRGLRAHQR